MKNIAKLRVTVSYTVELTEIQVPDKVFDSLREIWEDGGEIDELNEFHNAAQDWLADNVKEDDALEWTYEIDDSVSFGDF